MTLLQQYDWRLPATYIGSWYAQLKALIESTYTSNGNLPVHIITHSMGGPTGLYFLNQMDQAWKDQYVASFIPIAGPWTGAPNALRALVCIFFSYILVILIAYVQISGDNFGLSVFGIDILSKTSLRDVARQAGKTQHITSNSFLRSFFLTGGIVELIPNTDLNTNSVSFVNDGTMNYTIPDFPNLFSKMGSPVCIASLCPYCSIILWYYRLLPLFIRQHKTLYKVSLHLSMFLFIITSPILISLFTLGYLLTVCTDMEYLQRYFTPIPMETLTKIPSLMIPILGMALYVLLL